MTEKELTADNLSSTVGDITDMWRQAKSDFGDEDRITKLLDEASGLVDEAWDLMREAEASRE